MYDFSQHKFRCSSWGHLFTEPKEKSPLDKYNEAVAKDLKMIEEHKAMKDGLKSKDAKLEAIKKNKLAIIELEKTKNNPHFSATAKKHLIDVYFANEFNLHSEIQGKALDKGILCEEESITLYSRVKRKVFRKNTTRLFNDFLQGEPDIFEGESIGSAKKIIDIKTSWDHITFGRNLAEDNLKDIYYYQLMGYMWLTGAREATVSYCLVNTPPDLIDWAKNSLAYKIGTKNPDNEIYRKACEELERNSNYDHIPIEQRIIEFDVKYDEDVIEIGKEKIIKCREYLVNLQKSRIN